MSWIIFLLIGETGYDTIICFNVDVVGQHAGSDSITFGDIAEDDVFEVLSKAQEKRK
jgi:hypothetical protein